MTTTATTKLPAVRSGAAEKPRSFRFTDKFLKKAMTPEELNGRREVIQFEDGTGLGVRISATNCSFICQLKRDGMLPYRATVGSYDKLTIEQARGAVKALAGKIALGKDPDVERREAAAKAKAEAEANEAERFTVQVLVDRWKREHLDGQRRNYATSVYRRVVQHFEGLLGVPAMLVDRKEVRRMVEATRKSAGPAAARNSVVSLKSAFRWALGQDLIAADPLNGFVLPKKLDDRERVLTLEEARRVWSAAGELPYPNGQFIKLLMLTGCRRSEILGLRWEEEVGADAIELPGARTKTGSGHRIPLSTAMRAVLDDCRHNRIANSPYVLSNSGHTALRNAARVKTALDEALDEPVEDFRLHDLRRTIVSILAEKGYNPIVLDKLLGHQPRALSAIARIYQRHDHADERAQALEAWGDLLTQPKAEIVELKKRRK
jgi:integrase